MTNDNEEMKMEPLVKKQNVENGEDTPRDSPDDYDPHLHRNVAHPTSNMETLIHMVKGSLGTGILAMPEAFKNAGLLNGFVFTLLIGVLCTYGLHILVKSQYILCKRLKIPILTYPESMKFALKAGPKAFHGFAEYAPLLVDIFLIIYQLGICCVYVVFVAVNLQVFVNDYLDEPLDVKVYTIILLLPFVLINLVRNLKLLAPFSTVANILTFLSFGIVLYYVFQDLPSLTSMPAFGTLYTFPLFFGTTLFALEAVGVVIALENNMKTPKDFGGTFGVLNIAMFGITLLYTGMGFLGYWKYGDGVKASITLNFPSGDILAKTVKILYSLAIYISYGLQGYVPIDIIWNTYLLKHIKDSEHILAWEYFLRITVVLVTFILAVSIPLLGLFISLFGAFCLSALGIAFPAIMEICVHWPDNLGPANWVLIRNILLILIGVLGLLAGSFSALAEIVRELSS